MVTERFAAQLLAGPSAGTPEDAVGRLLAVQAQDPRGARLAIRARSTGSTAADIDGALSEDRSLLITWLNRGTLHLVRSEDYPWLHALTTRPLFTVNSRRLAQEGVRPDLAERGIATIERALADDGPQTRVQLRDRLDRRGIPTKGQALVHLLMLASLRGLVVRGPMVGREQAYVLVRDWLAPRREDRDRSLAELARRYLAGHGPACDRDLARWAGLPLRDARAGLAAIASEIVDRPDGLVDLAGRRVVDAELPPPRLLGAFEPVLLGWTSREWLLGADARRVTVEGLFRPFALVGGRAAGVWSLRDHEVVLEPFRRVPARVAKALEADAHDVVRFLGG
jgi:winged helix DNA-binding protein